MPTITLDMPEDAVARYFRDEDVYRALGQTALGRYSAVFFIP